VPEPVLAIAESEWNENNPDDDDFGSDQVGDSAATAQGRARLQLGLLQTRRKAIRLGAERAEASPSPTTTRLSTN
jgi:hypothetical protein